MENNKTIYDLLHRRSIRSFKEQPLEKEVLEKILEVGTYAPTAMGKQSPVMVVLQRKEDIEEMEKINCMFTKQEHPFYGAPCVVVVLADGSRATCVEDGSLVLGNLMNAAAALGVGSCWINRAKESFETKEGKALLKKWGLPDTLVGIGNCILGYADCDEPVAKPRKENYILYI